MTALKTLEDASAAIRRGAVIAVPTDTVYGLACDPANAAAVDRIYAIKQRPASFELTLLCTALSEIEDDVEVTTDAGELASAYWPGSLSIVMHLRRRRWAIPRAGATLSCRVPAHHMLLALLRLTGPLASTSANRHHQAPTITAAQARAALGADVEAVIDGGPASGQASTIIDCTTKPPRLLRAGPLSADELLARLGASHPTKGQRQG
jgi:L-threonylcarbamoyladenylate synthase